MVVVQEKEYKRRQVKEKMEVGDVLAFDLFLEWQRIHEEGLSSQVKKHRFIENARTHKMEEYGIPYASFKPYLFRQSENGIREIFTEGYSGPMREIYNPYNPEFEWPQERLEGVNLERALVEYRTFCKFEQSREFQNAQDGDLFIWISMPPTDILEAESLFLEEKTEKLRKLGYGFHTNVFVFEAGEKFLQGRVLPNYFSMAGNRQLLQKLGIEDNLGQNPTDIELLGHIYKIDNPSIESARDVRELMGKMDEYEVELPDELKEQGKLSEGDMEKILNEARPLLEQVYYILADMEQDDFSSTNIVNLLEQKLDAWENIVAILAAGEEYSLVEIVQLTHLELEELVSNQLAEARGLAKLRGLDRMDLSWVIMHDVKEADPRILDAAQAINQLARSDYYQPRATGCGIGGGLRGSGFTNLFSDPIQEIMNPLNIAATYKSAESLIKGSDSEKYIWICSKCKHRHKINVDTGDLKNKCEKCGASGRC